MTTGESADVVDEADAATPTHLSPQPHRRTSTNNYNPGRDWHGQNIRMVQALTAKGYDVNYAWTLGTHSNKHGGAIMPEMLRWLWRDYPRADNPADAGNRTPFVTTTQVPAPDASPAK